MYLEHQQKGGLNLVGAQRCKLFFVKFVFVKIFQTLCKFFLGYKECFAVVTAQIDCLAFARREAVVSVQKGVCIQVRARFEMNSSCYQTGRHYALVFLKPFSPPQYAGGRKSLVHSWQKITVCFKSENGNEES